MKRELSISVRDIVDYSLRSGDLDLTFTGTVRSIEGIRFHQMLQKSRPEDYTSEVSVSRTVETEKCILRVNGRIDGVFHLPGRVVIDEIKTTRMTPEEIEKSNNPIHWGQVKTYACIYAHEHDIGDLAVQLTYVNTDTNDIRTVRRSFTRDELEEFFHSLINRYLIWSNTIADWIETRDSSILELTFPYESYRDGQRDMAVRVYMTIKNSGKTLVQAPTGIGKTMAALFSSAKAMAEGLTTKLFYLTARTTGKTIAEDTLLVLKEHGLRFKFLTLTAKEKICFSPGSACNGEECTFARGHFDRVNDALIDAFQYDSLSRGVVEDIARKHRVCPFEFSLDLALWADCVICDYNYVFDPRVYLRRFFLDEKGKHTFLVDEAHNLVDRAREMFSAELSKQSFLDLRRLLKPEQPGIYKTLGAVNAWMVKARKRCDEERNPLADTLPPSDLYPHLRKFITASERWLARTIKTPWRQELLDVFFAVNTFLKIAELFDDTYSVILEKREKELLLKLYCLDPAVQLKKALMRAIATVFFSATLAPMDYYREIFGCEESAVMMTLPSPFPPENVCLLIEDRISTLYRNRDRTKAEVAESLSALVGKRNGNYLIYFPSYEYMTSIYEIFRELTPQTEAIIQSRGMPESERTEFIERFAYDNPDTLTGFAVMGGIFGEGIDLVGDRLTGAIIVGVGLPGICIERDLIRDYFNRKSGKGFEYAYLYPGINKVFQAAGRVIRTENDRGVIMLVDERFATMRYRSLYPREWRPVFIGNGKRLNDVLNTFWEQKKPEKFEKFTLFKLP